ncbi:transporter substrate-binding domain-containing protein [Suttonella ornithocola]|uniref:transporter substrate-binding domain-containing protein n=1 Tax=Suttonella ornithocola TaxID=279832 RepID=UPI003D15F690
MKKVLTGKNDAAVSDFGVVKYYQKRYNDLNYLVIPNSTVEFGFGVKKGNHVLAEILNRGLKTIKENGTYDKIYQQYFAD